MSLYNETTNDTNLCATTEEGEYDLNLHIISVFILLVTSLLGVALPSVVKYLKWAKLNWILRVGKFFGAGVITATGFVHIFPDAVSTLNNPCLPSFFSTQYTAAAGLFAMAAAFLVHLIEYLAINLTSKNEYGEISDTKLVIKECDHHGKPMKVEDKDNDHEGHTHSLLLDRKRRISTYILELAISIHSIIIGIDLGVTTDEANTLLIALTMHQFFEGLGLGYRIAEIKYESKLPAVFNSLAYAVTTPLGVCIGIAVHITSTSTTASSIIFKGVVDSLAAGVMIYAALVTLIAEEFTSRKFTQLSPLGRAVCFLSLYMGVGLMSVIGLWA